MSPSFGARVRAAPGALYANLSSSFETPTTTELGNKPDGSSGINPTCSRSVPVQRVGAKGFSGMAPLRWDVALFQARARDELVPTTSPAARAGATTATPAARCAAAARLASEPRPAR